MLFAKKAVHSALLLAWVMITLAFFYIAEGALFLGIVQVVVYTGAVMMLFLFILMLVGVDSSDSLVETIKGQRSTSIVAAVGLGGLLISLVGRATVGAKALGVETANAKGNVQALAEELFTKYVWAFEVVSALLITAALGAMVLAHSQNIWQRPLVYQRQVFLPAITQLMFQLYCQMEHRPHHLSQEPLKLVEICWRVRSLN